MYLIFHLVLNIHAQAEEPILLFDSTPSRRQHVHFVAAIAAEAALNSTSPAQVLWIL